MKTFSKILVANRGEIAVRVMKTCKSLGISTVAVYSEADRNSYFVSQADEAVFIGEAAALKSYLNIPVVIQAALRVGADAIHPGYGFLSENGDFSDACLKAGIVFIGPMRNTIDVLGNKTQVKLMLAQDRPEVPLIPGYNGKDQSDETLAREAQRIGFPVLLKASCGGGGKGMRIVNEAAALNEAISGVKREAQNSFGNAELLVEKYFSSSRHVEFQIFGDSHGNVVHLGERDCSVQRRFQKVIEETPSPCMTPELRAEMGACAVLIGKMLNYLGAGTVEFLVDHTNNFYFLEVNTRLQVEHAITEMVQDVDLVHLQIHAAQGGSLGDFGLLPGATQRPGLFPSGHSIECRLYAEDPRNNFFPATGTLLNCCLPK